MDLVLGVDAGATKTLAAVADLTGRIRGRGRAGCGNFQVNGPGAPREVKRAIRRALVAAGADPPRVVAAYYGMAGADRPSDFSYIHSFLEPINPAPRWETENDATVALLAATRRRLGVVVVCGTGFNCLAFTPEGTRLQVGGLGYIFGDFAGAGQIGAEVIRAATRAYDGRGPATVLLDLVREQFGVEDPSDLAAMMYPDAPRPLHPAELAPLAFQAAAQGDAVALELLQRSAEEMGLAARVAIARAGLDALPRIPVVLAGALLQGDPGRLLAPLVTAGVTGAYPQAEVTVLDTEPVLGAVVGALELAGVTVDDEVVATLRASWQTAEAALPPDEAPRGPLPEGSAAVLPGPVAERREAVLPGPRPDRGLKVTVVGGGSTYTPELVSGLVEARDAFPLRELVLMDIDPARLEAVGGLAGRMLEDAGLGKALCLSGDLDEALRGADYVVVQIRVGGLPARLLDERIPLELGCIGQETVGAGGISCALRTVPVVLDIARRMERLCPEAWLINFTNPSGLITEALYRHADVRAVGLCNVPITMRKALAAALLETGAAGTGDRGPGIDYVGLNHLGWFVGVRDEQGRELLPLILSGHLSQVAERVEVDADLIAAWGAIPNPYLRYYCHPDRVLARMKAAGRARAEEVIELEARLLEMYRNPGLRRRPPKLDGRGGAYYSLAAVELMLSLAGIRPGEHVVSVPHQGKIPELPGDTVAELTCRVDRDEITPAPAGTLTPAASGGTLPPGTAGLVRTVKDCELLAIEAAVRGSRPLAYLALASHPLVPSAGVARQLLERLVEAHAAYLPPGLRA